MSANSETMNYKLPVFLANDIPSWLTDWNGSMRKIDELIFNANSEIGDLKTKDTQVENTVNGINERLTTVENDLDPTGTGVAKDVATLQTKVNNHTEQLTELDTVTTNLTTLCGNTTLQTSNKTLTGAVNELNTDNTSLSTLCGNEVLKTTAKTLTGAVNELASKGTESDFEETLTAGNTSIKFKYEATTGRRLMMFDITEDIQMKEFTVSTPVATKLTKHGFSGVMGTADGIIALILPDIIAGQKTTSFYITVLEISGTGVTKPGIAAGITLFK